MTIRKATLADYENVQKLNSELFLYEKKFGDTYDETWPYKTRGKEYYARMIVSDSACVLVAELETHIVGYLISYVDTYSARSVNPIAELENMFVKEEFRGQGIGSRLIEEFKKFAKEKSAKRLKVSLLINNDQARNFYAKNGFQDFSLNMEQDL